MIPNFSRFYYTLHYATSDFILLLYDIISYSIKLDMIIILYHICSWQYIITCWVDLSLHITCIATSFYHMAIYGHMAYGFVWCVWGCMYWHFLLPVFSSLKNKQTKIHQFCNLAIWNIGAGPKTMERIEKQTKIKKVHLVWAYVLQMFQNTEKWKTCKNLCKAYALVCTFCACAVPMFPKEKHLKLLYQKIERVRKKYANLLHFCLRTFGGVQNLNKEHKRLCMQIIWFLVNTWHAMHMHNSFILIPFFAHNRTEQHILL